jgi:hypothetical protein
VISPLSPIASLCFVALSGPTPLIPAPRDVTGRLRMGVVLVLILLQRRAVGAALARAVARPG